MDEEYQSAQIASQYTPETILSADEFYRKWMKEQHPTWSDKDIGNYNDFNYKVAKFFGDPSRNRFDSEYDAYLANINNRNELRALQSANSIKEYFDSTEYQRAYKDMEKAGINPYLLMTGSGFSPSGGTSISSANYRQNKEKPAQSRNGRDMALILLAVARLAAALL